jgi:hypothetical protein
VGTHNPIPVWPRVRSEGSFLALRKNVIPLYLPNLILTSTGLVVRIDCTMESPFINLPTEILGQIVLELNFNDLFSVRCLFNKTIHAKTLPYCASKLFKIITADVSLSHLEKLQKLARSNLELIGYIKTLHFAGD